MFLIFLSLELLDYYVYNNEIISAQDDNTFNSDCLVTCNF